MMLLAAAEMIFIVNVTDNSNNTNNLSLVNDGINPWRNISPGNPIGPTSIEEFIIIADTGDAICVSPASADEVNILRDDATNNKINKNNINTKFLVFCIILNPYVTKPTHPNANTCPYRPINNAYTADNMPELI